LFRKWGKYGLYGEGEEFMIAFDFPGSLPEDGRRVFICQDFPHSIKKFVNSLERSGNSEFFSRRMQKRVNFKDSMGRECSELQMLSLCQLYDMWSRMLVLPGLLVVTGFKLDDFKRNSYQRMRVGPAMRVLGHKMLHLMECEARFDRGAWQSDRALLEFVKEMTNLQAVMNNPRMKLDDDSPELSVLEGFSDYLSAWRQDILTRPGVTERNVKKLFFTNQAYEDMMLSMRGLVGCVRYYCNKTDVGKKRKRYLLPHMCSQDKIEHHFSILKSFLRGGRQTVDKVQEVSRSWSIVKALCMEKPPNEKTNVANRNVFEIQDVMEGVNDSQERLRSIKKKRMSAPAALSGTA
jgi:hypothetical protein